MVECIGIKVIKPHVNAPPLQLDPHLGQVEHITPSHPTQGHSGWVSDIAFSPDGSTLASASHDKTVKIWSVESKEEGAKLEGHEGWVLGVAEW